MDSIVGFVLSKNLSPDQSKRAVEAQQTALRHFPWLERQSLQIGETVVHVWGHGRISDRLHRLEDETLLVAIGSPAGEIDWSLVEEDLKRAERAEHLTPPWEGRLVLLRVSPDGSKWTMWNDWIGSIPVFHTELPEGRIAGTMEPAIVAAAGFSLEDFFVPGLISLLVNGHYLGERTLFKGLGVVPPDCVAEWDSAGYRWKRLWTVRPSDERWNASDDELVEEMDELFRAAVTSVLGSDSSWILPLSGGLDSRLIAAVGSDLGVELHAYTYGHSDWAESVYARQVANRLAIPWQGVPIPPDYLERFTGMWLEWFGSAMHCHGMYQMPFLTHLSTQPAGRIIHGFAADSLVGKCVDDLVSTHRDPGVGVELKNPGIYCETPYVEQLLVDRQLGDHLEAVRAQTKHEIEQIPGEWYQQLMYADFWNRQRLLVYYHPTMYDYYRGVVTPLVNRDYARFCFSLPRHALEGRRLQVEMLRRKYPRMAAIRGTFGKPTVLTASYLSKKIVARALPRSMRKGFLVEFGTTQNKMHLDALEAHGEDCLWPLNQVRHRLGDLFNLELLEQTYREAVAGDEAAYHRLLPIQTVALYYVG
jgi:hypothetical protein